MILGVSILDLEGVIKFVLSISPDPETMALTKRIMKSCTATAKTNTDDDNLDKVSVVDFDLK